MSPSVVLIGPNGVVAEEVRFATTPRARRRGVLGRDRLGSEEALVIQPCRRVHTFGVGYPLDVVFCDGSWSVLHVETLGPRRISRRIRSARSCIELVGGRAVECGIEPGVRLSFEDPEAP